MPGPARGTESASPAAFPMEAFLDRLMAAESGGRLHKKNPRSTALGPFQFIESTFLFVVNRHFPSEVVGLAEQQVLALRTDMAFSRRAAGAYASDLISALKDNGLRATTVNVRLAFLVGPVAAVRLLKAPPDQSLKSVLSADAIAANPYMSGATVAKLVRKAAADVSATAATQAARRLEGRRPGCHRVGPGARAGRQSGCRGGRAGRHSRRLAGRAGRAPAVSERAPAGTPAASNGEPTATTPADAPFEIKCEIGLASCRRWIALQERKAQLLARNAQR